MNDTIRVNELIKDKLIDLEDKEIVNNILNDKIKDISLLELQTIKHKTLNKIKSVDNKNKKAFLLGFLGIINLMVKDWGTKGVYTIM